MALHNSNYLKSSSKMLKLDPFLDHDSLLKVEEELENVTYQHPT